MKTVRLREVKLLAQDHIAIVKQQGQDSDSGMQNSKTHSLKPWALAALIPQCSEQWDTLLGIQSRSCFI